MANNSKRLLDLPMFRPVGTQPSITQGQGQGVVGSGLCTDYRSRNYADPQLWVTCSSLTAYMNYNKHFNGWNILQFSPALGGTATGQSCVFVPTQGPSGTLAAGATTTKITLTTALPASVELGQLAGRGDGTGYIIRVIGNSAGGSGMICERRIINNTSGTTPTLYLDSALDFTPQSGDRYELLSGSWFVLTTGAAKEWRKVDVATGFVSAALSVANLPGTIGVGYNDLVTLDEQYVPAGNYPGEGFVKSASTYDSGINYVKFCLSATATAAGTITGHATSGDDYVAANQFRNFQIRIVKDTTNPTSVGQRRRITSHTAGPSAVYTLASNWTVTPSATASYVIENDNDKLILFTAATAVYNYNHTANTWDTSTWAARPTAPTQGGGTMQAFGLVDPTNVARNSFIYSYRAVATGGNPMDVLDIAGAATGSWSSFALTPNYLTQSLSSQTFGTAYDPYTNNGKYIYMLGPFQTSLQPLAIYRFNMLTRTKTPYSQLPVPAGTTVSDQITNKFGLGVVYDGSDTFTFLYLRKPQSSLGEMYQCAINV